ncbi:MAG: nickel pincer cofactor biosynthesis protein LarC [Clostridia bacterium]|nr:nickel pincer cofactor biosynthesis protein LarC [Clostridia bacterium]
MKVLYFDCSSGICGNMTLGALTEIIGDENYLVEELKKLNVDGYKIEISKKDSHGISGTFVNVIVDGEDEYGHVHHLHEDEHHHDHEHTHDDEHNHEHHHAHRNLDDVNKIIDNSSLEDKVKDLAKAIFLKVAKAESKVHGKPLEEVHFHEVGAIDSIVDIVGTAILIHKINPDKILSSTVNEGHGFIVCAHGKMSVPVPATSEIFASEKVKFRQIDVDTELVTPTGAAIIATLSEKYDTMPEMILEKVGFGQGSKDIGYANSLKVYYGEIAESKHDMYVIETNIDDSTGEMLGYCMGKLLEAKANDVFYTPIVMKKNRPAYKLEVICEKDNLDNLLEIIFKETTTIGARFYKVDRAELKREMVEIDTKYGKVSGKKITTPKGAVYVYPEYESIKKLAEEKDIPLKEIYKF